MLASESMPSSQSGERGPEDLIEAELLDCMVVPPSRLFYSAWIPACPRILAVGSKRRAEMRFIDARRLGGIVDRTHRGLADDVATIAAGRHAWRTASPMFPLLAGAPRCTCCATTAICWLRDALSGTTPEPDEGELPDSTMKRLVAELHAQ